MSDLSATGNTPSSNSIGSHSGTDDTIGRLREDAIRKANEAESAGQNATSDFQNTTSGIKDQIGAVARDLGEEASGVAGGLKGRALEFAEDRKSVGADKLSSLAGTVDQVAANLEEQSPQAARYVRDAASGMERLSSHLRDRSVEDLTTDARNFARRQPLLVFGGAIVAGLALARLLKSSSSHNQQSASNEGYGARDYGSFDGGRNVYDR